jgi:hypothetical protein
MQLSISVRPLQWQRGPRSAMVEVLCVYSHGSVLVCTAQGGSH